MNISEEMKKEEDDTATSCSSKKDKDENWQDADYLCFESSETEEEGKEAWVPTDDHPVVGTTSSENTTNDKKNESRGVIPCISEFTLELAPWMESVPGNYTNPLIRLHNEIADFAALMMPTEEEVKERQELTNKVKELVLRTFGEDKCEVVVFGSQATELYLPEADIDMVINLSKDAAAADDYLLEDEDSRDEESASAKEHREMQQWDTPTGCPLDRLADAIKQSWKDHLVYLEVLKNTRVPIVKFTHGPTNISFDVCFDQTSGPLAAAITNNFLQTMPPLRPLTLILKYFTKARGINEPYYGGIGSYMLTLMIVSFLQHRSREEYITRARSVPFNLGALLLEFFELYGLDFNFLTTGISLRNDGSYFPKGAHDKRNLFFIPSRPFSLAIEDPCDPTQDVGRSTFRMNFIQRSFEVAFQVLLGHTSEPYIPCTSILAAILPPTDEMKKRAALFKTLKLANQIQAYNKTHPTSTSTTYYPPPLKTARGKRHSPSSSSPHNFSTAKKNKESSDMSTDSSDEEYHHHPKSFKRARSAPTNSRTTSTSYPHNRGYSQTSSAKKMGTVNKKQQQQKYPSNKRRKSS